MINYEALKAKKPADIKSLKSQAAGYVTDDNTGGYYVVECQECGEVYPSQECDGGGQIADTGDYNDALCPHCGCESPEECNDTPLVWNVQQAKINALLAALEEKDQRIAELETKYQQVSEWYAKMKTRMLAAEGEVKQWHDVATAAAQDDADWHKLTDRKNDLICKLVDAGIAQITRANAAEQREGYLKASVDVLSAKNAELEQRLQQPIKLPDIRSEDYHESGWFQHMKYYRAVVRSIQVLELKVEGE